MPDEEDVSRCGAADVGLAGARSGEESVSESASDSRAFPFPLPRPFPRPLPFDLPLPLRRVGGVNGRSMRGASESESY